MPDRHPTTSHWIFPPADRAPLPGGLSRVSLRELEARPDRFEHHLMVVGRVGVAQLEIATASEPLYFAHRNISDEYVVPMTTGDAMAEMMPVRVFVGDLDRGVDLGRIVHRANQMVLHPYGMTHWPGRLRPPYETFQFAPGLRRCMFSLVICASRPTAPPPDRPLRVTAGLEADVKAYTDTPVPFLLADLRREAPCELGRIGDTSIELIVSPERVAPERGGYLVVIEAEGETHFAGDLIHVPAGAEVPVDGLGRALLVSGAREPAPPPESWQRDPTEPFAVYEQGEPGALPVSLGALRVEEVSPAVVAVRFGDAAPAEVPRYWLARMLFRIALHAYSMGYLETYGGFFYDDGDADAGHRLGVRGRGAVAMSRIEIAAAVERLYRAVAPAGYVERLT